MRPQALTHAYTPPPYAMFFKGDLLTAAMELFNWACGSTNFVQVYGSFGEKPVVLSREQFLDAMQRLNERFAEERT